MNPRAALIGSFSADLRHPVPHKGYSTMLYCASPCSRGFGKYMSQNKSERIIELLDRSYLRISAKASYCYVVLIQIQA